MKKYKTLLISCSTLAIALFSCAESGEDKADCNEPVNFSQVKITDNFWLPRIQRLAEVTIPACLNQCENETQRVKNFAIAGGLEEGEFTGIFYDDSDLYKMIEGCAYSLINYPNPELEAKLDTIIDKIASAQQEDGYINTYFTLVNPEGKWTDMDMHEMYCGGHLIEAAIAYYNATGKDKLLNVAVKFANHIDDTFGEGKRVWVPGHEEIELALVKLYRQTGEHKYLDLAKWLLSQRGHGHGDWTARGTVHGAAQRQDSIPVEDLEKISGHAVRAAYLFTGMADVDHALADTAYTAALHRLWNDVVFTKMYATGGIGSSKYNEGFTADYDLPNEEAYCETCASVGMVLWNQRMNMLEGDGKYVDILEKAMYNGALAGVSLSADRFFYVNPLESQGGHHRQAWYGTACCPSQISRFLPSVGNYIYATSEGKNPALWVNLYIGSETNVALGNDTVNIKQNTAYPWDGNVKLGVNPTSDAEFTLKLRLPAWCDSHTLKVNGEEYAVAPDMQYLDIKRVWQPGDVVEFNMDMPVKIVAADPRVKADEGKRHLERGPLVYCMEEVDNANYDGAILSADTKFDVNFQPDVLGGVATITATTGDDSAVFIPYYAWDNRDPGKMKVWVDFKE